MRRRDLCIAISVLPMAFATKARAQGGPLRVGWVSTERSTVPSPFLEALRQGLRELGYIEGRNLVLDVWWGKGSTEPLLHGAKVATLAIEQPSVFEPASRHEGRQGARPDGSATVAAACQPGSPMIDRRGFLGAAVGSLALPVAGQVQQAPPSPSRVYRLGILRPTARARRQDLATLDNLLPLALGPARLCRRTQPRDREALRGRAA